MRRQLEGQGFHLATLDSLKYSYKILNTDKATRTVYCVKKGLWSEQGSQISTIEILTRAYTTDPIFINLKARKGRKLHKAIFICKTIEKLFKEFWFSKYTYIDVEITQITEYWILILIVNIDTQILRNRLCSYFICLDYEDKNRKRRNPLKRRIFLGHFLIFIILLLNVKLSIN